MTNTLATGRQWAIPTTPMPRLGAVGGDLHVTQEIDTSRGDRPRATGDPLLRVRDLRSGYGNVPVIHGLSFDVYPGETAVILGLNGAGKSTTALNLVGQVATWDGTIEFDGRDASKWSTKRAVKEGIVLVPEGRRVFPGLTVSRNLEVGAWSRRRDGSWLEEQRERVYGYFPRLGERRDQLAGTLSGGEQQMLAIGRGLMARPRLLIIDEASLGLAPVIVKDVFAIVRQINADGTTVILIEQNVGALEVADIGLVMEQGRVVAAVQGEELADPSRVRKIFLG
jgi:branched-chain amino acid transport system ATP-binding protein